MKKIITLFIFLTCLLYVNSQSVKPLLKAGNEFFENSKYNEAIEQYTKAIEILPTSPKAYILRAKAYQKLAKPQKAAEDFDNAAMFDKDDEESLAEAARLYFELKDYPKTIDRCTASLLISTNWDVLTLKTDAELKNKNYAQALIDAKDLLRHKSSDANYYRLALANENSGFNVEALIAYQNAIDRNKKNYEALTSFAALQFKTKNSAGALINANEAIKINSKYAEAYRVRANILSEELKVAEVINDMSTVILLEPNIDENYFARGVYYQIFAQQINAINDYTKVISLNPTRADAYYKRATAYEQIMNYKEAIKDYEALKKLNISDKNIEDLLVKSQERLFELNRETEKPLISVTIPRESANKILLVPNTAKEIVMAGTIADQSALKSLSINNQPITFEKSTEGYKFSATVNIGNDTTINLNATDAYDNSQNTVYNLLKTETDTPIVKIMVPYASDNNTIYLDTQEPKIFLEGKISDESLIASISIDGVMASYTPTEENPTFQTYINIANKDKFTVTVEDKCGNKSENIYSINRDGVTISEGNPMGKTWVIFVENSNYTNFANLEGPTKDVSLMKSALTKYNVNNLIHKKDMTKQEMEKFFSIELRDLVKNNHVNSLLIWYAGHGKFLNETGYWVAVDAKRDDEFTYFNISSLRASLSNYNLTVDHTLVITDACESGPSFYQAMRSEAKPRSCGDLSAKMKSSQVFSSAGYELAVDNSQFTKTFANTLINSQDACLPIESIVQRVTTAVQGNNQQKPLFGKIAGLGDEDGTFFFIAK